MPRPRHLGKPPLDGDADDLEAWAAAASGPNVAAKISGLTTATNDVEQLLARTARRLYRLPAEAADGAH